MCIHERPEWPMEHKLNGGTVFVAIDDTSELRA